MSLTFAPRLELADLNRHALLVHAGGDNYADQWPPLCGRNPRGGCGVISTYTTDGTSELSERGFSRHTLPPICERFHSKGPHSQLDILLHGRFRHYDFT